MSKSVLVMMTAVLILVLSACEHKELCYDHDGHSSGPAIDLDFSDDWEINVDGEVNWDIEILEEFGLTYDDVKPSIPEGIRVQVYREDGQVQVYNYPVTGGTLTIHDPMLHEILFFNNDTRYIDFQQMHDINEAFATTLPLSRPSYKGNQILAARGEEEYTVNEPDMLYGCHIPAFNPAEYKEDSIKVRMQPLVYSYIIRYEFSHGLEYVAQTKGAITGMARSVNLKTGRTSSDRATILFECDMGDFGSQQIVKSFGTPNADNPNYSRADDVFYGLTLEVTLNNGLHKNYDFDVTSQLLTQPHGGIIVVKDIEVPDEAGNAGGGGFDVDVGGWDDYEDIELPLGK